MAKHTPTLHEQAQLLVESILSKNTLNANLIFKQLIAEAEEIRESEVQRIISEQDEEFDDDLGDETDDTGDEADEAEDTDEDAGDEPGTDESMSDADAAEKIDDALEIQCQINAKRITHMFDVIAELKKALDGKGLDPNSKEYIKGDVTIAYYSDKLQEFQGKTNPGVDQAKLEEALDKISEALEELNGEFGGESAEVDTDIDTPAEVEADTDATEEPAEEETTEDTTEESEGESEGEPEAESEETEEANSEESDDELESETQLQ